MPRRAAPLRLRPRGPPRGSLCALDHRGKTPEQLIGGMRLGLVVGKVEEHGDRRPRFGVVEVRCGVAETLAVVAPPAVGLTHAERIDVVGRTRVERSTLLAYGLGLRSEERSLGEHL